MKKVLFFLMIFCSFLGLAQKNELGKVTIEELQEKVYSADTSAAAAITFTRGKTKFRYFEKKGFTIVHECEFRIKIYKKEGLSWANYKVPYYIGYKNINNDAVTFTQAVTYNLSGKEIVKTKLGNEGKFKNQLNEYWAEASITMPNVQVGSVIEFKYEIESQDIGEFPIFYFQHSIPVKFAEYTSEIPEYYLYKPIIRGFVEVKSDAKVGNGYQNFINEHNQTVNLSYRQVNSVYKAEQIPALKPEPYVDRLENYRSAIYHELEKTRYPDAPEKDYVFTWEGVAKTIYKDDRFGKELDQRQYFESDLEKIIEKATTDSEKISAVFEFVKTSMNWDKTFSYYAKKGVKKAYQDRTGNTAEINFILISMLNRAGLNAYPVLVSTVDNGIAVYPNLRIFNHVVASVDQEGKRILLDASQKDAEVNVLPEFNLNWTGRLIKKDGSSEEINLFPTTPSRKVVNMTANIGADGSVSGKMRITRSDYLAIDFKDKYQGQSQEEYTDALEKSFGMTVSNYSREQVKARPLTENIEFATKTDVLDQKIYLHPLVFFNFDKNPFQSQQRKLPIYYGYPIQFKYNISLVIPEGYAIESIPSSISISTGEEVGFFTFNCAGAENKIQVSATFDIKQSVISGDFYEPLKAFYDRVIQKQTEKIILKKL